MTVPNHIAGLLLESGAVVVAPEQPITWTSGLRAPIYCDNRLLISSPPARKAVIDEFEAVIKNRSISCEVIAGTATAGIPWATLLADRLGLPMVYVRSSPKGHGTGRQVEGGIPHGAETFVIEDLISTGGSARTSIEALRREHHADITAVLSIFTYELLAAKETFDRLGVPLISLCTFGQVVEQVKAEFPVEVYHHLCAWQKDPQAWSEQNGRLLDDLAHIW